MEPIYFSYQLTLLKPNKKICFSACMCILAVILFSIYSSISRSFILIKEFGSIQIFIEKCTNFIPNKNEQYSSSNHCLKSICSTGHIAEEIGQLARKRLKSYIAFGRNVLSQSETIKIGNDWDIKWHGLQTRLSIVTDWLHESNKNW